MTASLWILGSLTVPRDACALPLGFQKTWLEQATNGESFAVPITESGCVTWSLYTQVCVCCEHVCAVQRLQRLQWQEMRHSSQCFVFFLIKTFPFSCTFASCEQGPGVPFCGEVRLW